VLAFDITLQLVIASAASAAVGDAAERLWLNHVASSRLVCELRDDSDDDNERQITNCLKLSVTAAAVRVSRIPSSLS